MQSLYSNGFEHIYDAMYRSFINYQDEYDFYSALLNTYFKKSILEIGCGTGNLAAHFIESNIQYSGLDLSEDMVKLANQKNPKGDFYQGNMANFKVGREIDAVLITGRTTSYLLENKDLNGALQSIKENLTENGLLIFDFIDASRFFNTIKNGKAVKHIANYNGIQYLRSSHMKVNTELNNFMFDWKASYYKETNQEKILIAEDDSTVRAFTKDEWKLLLELNDYEILECIDRKSYAFDTYVYVARLKNPKL